MIGKTFHYDLTILERQLDTFGHVNNAKYLEIFEEARWDMVTEGGFGIEDIKISGTGPVVLAVNVKFKKELKLREKIRVSTTTVSYNKKIAMIRQSITNESDEVCAEADFTMGFFDTIARRLISPSEKWKLALGIGN